MDRSVGLITQVVSIGIVFIVLHWCYTGVTWLNCDVLPGIRSELHVGCAPPWRAAGCGRGEVCLSGGTWCGIPSLPECPPLWPGSQKYILSFQVCIIMCMCVCLCVCVCVCVCVYWRCVGVVHCLGSGDKTNPRPRIFTACHGSYLSLGTRSSHNSLETHCSFYLYLWNVIKLFFFVDMIQKLPLGACPSLMPMASSARPSWLHIWPLNQAELHLVQWSSMPSREWSRRGPGDEVGLLTNGGRRNKQLVRFGFMPC